MANDIPLFARIDRRYINVAHIVSVSAEGKDRTLIETTLDPEQPYIVKLPLNEVLNAIAAAERPIGLA